MSFSVQTCTGAGVLARYGGSVVLAPDDSPVLDAVLELAREADRDHAEEPGRFLPRKTAGVVASSDDQLTLAVLSELRDGIAVLLVGDVSVTLEDGTVLSGRDATTWVDRIIRDPWSSLTVTLDGAGPAQARSDVQGGVVAAGGAVLTRSSESSATPTPALEPTPTPTPTPAPSPEPVFASFSLAPDEPGEPLPVATAAIPSIPEPVADGVMVQGIACSRQHFNDPAAVYCAICGISMVHQTHNLVPGVRPPLGVLVFDDGAVHTVDRDYVLGREPDAAPEVTSGSAVALTLDDPDLTMSRVHSRLLLVDWQAQLSDAGSANGTYVAQPGAADWTRLQPGEIAVLTPGTRIGLGGRTLVFDSHHKL